MKAETYAFALVAIVLMAAMGARADSLKKLDFTENFPDPADCNGLAVDTAGGAQNRYWPLEVNRTWTLSNASCVADGDCGELEEVRITVLTDTETVDGTLTRVVEEVERVNGVLTEASRNFFVECVGSEDVYYFGEDVDIFHEDGSVSHEGQWRAGGPNRPGIIMPGGAFLIGARYFQEWAPGLALDRAEHAAMGLSIDNPAGGEFDDCVLVEDSNALEDPKGKASDEKTYCPGIGIVGDEEMELTSCLDGGGAACSQ